MEYKIISHGFLPGGTRGSFEEDRRLSNACKPEFEQMVTKAMNEGWRPSGAPVVDVNGPGQYYAQAMVRAAQEVDCPQCGYEVSID